MATVYKSAIISAVITDEGIEIIILMVLDE
jgi:hypothetical protein